MLQEGEHMNLQVNRSLLFVRAGDCFFPCVNGAPDKAQHGVCFGPWL